MTDGKIEFFGTEKEIYLEEFYCVYKGHGL